MWDRMSPVEKVICVIVNAAVVVLWICAGFPVHTIW